MQMGKIVGEQLDGGLIVAYTVRVVYSSVHVRAKALRLVVFVVQGIADSVIAIVILVRVPPMRHLLMKTVAQVVGLFMQFSRLLRARLLRLAKASPDFLLTGLIIIF